MLNIATTIAALAVIVVAGQLVKDRYFAPTPSGLVPPKPIRDWQQYGQVGNRLGSRKAPVTIVEFADFQCPFCANAIPGLKDLRRRFGDTVALVFRHYPVTVHPFAFPAAIAAECAAKSNRFEAIHDEFYSHPDSIGNVAWTRIAEKAGVQDTTGFATCMSSYEAKRRVVEDTLAAHKLGVWGTPTFLINNLLVLGYRGPERMDSVVRAVLQARDH